MTKALLLENIHPSATEVFSRHGIDVETVSSSLSEDDLVAALPGFEILGIRSNTNLTQRVIESAPDLLAVGAFCIGTNQIDLPATTRRGIGAFNAPYSNTRSVVELVIGEIIALARRIPEKIEKMHAGVWDKSAKGSHEIRGRVLGIVGYGNIGSQLSVVAEAVGLRVIYYDTNDRLAHGNAERVDSLEELLGRADVVTLHVDGRPGNAGLFGDEQFRQMKPRSMFINASRGMVVDDQSLREHIESGHVSGAALDVFPVEPKAQGEEFQSVLRGLDNVILTPHVGGSTQEAQEEIGRFVSGKLAAYLQEGSTANSVSLPELQPSPLEGGFRIAHLHVNVPGVLAEINRVLLEEDANVVSQGLATQGEQGYAVTDVSGPVDEAVVDKLRAMSQTIWLRTFAD